MRIHRWGVLYIFLESLPLALTEVYSENLDPKLAPTDRCETLMMVVVHCDSRCAPSSSVKTSTLDRAASRSFHSSSVHASDWVSPLLYASTLTSDIPPAVG